MKRNLHTKKTQQVCGCANCNNYAGGPKGIGALNQLRCKHCIEKHHAGRYAKKAQEVQA